MSINCLITIHDNAPSSREYSQNMLMNDNHEKEPEVATTKKDPEVVTTKKEPDVVTTKKEPEVVTTKKEPEVVNTKKEPEVVNTKIALVSGWQI